MVVLDGNPLGVDDVLAVARDGARVEVGDEARQRMAPSRAVVEKLDEDDTIAYGVTTGFGALADRAVQPADRAALQRHVVLSHAAGMGAPLDAEVVRAMMLLRARTLCAGYSGVRPLLPEALAALLNSGLVPWVPESGSLGASGDLAPLAHACACLLGEGWVWDGSARLPAAAALAEQGLVPIDVGPREGLALINGTDGMCAVMTLAVADLEELLRAADVIAAMSVEALLGTTRAFAEDAVALRAAPGQSASAANLRLLLDDSALVASHRESHHAVQDPYSLRCTPQVHGAARDVHAFARECVVRELAAVVDNPMVLGGEVVSGGNFHGQALAYAADMLASICADLASISERRLDRLLDPARSRGLPAFLTTAPGLNSGLDDHPIHGGGHGGRATGCGHAHRGAEHVDQRGPGGPRLDGLHRGDAHAPQRRHPASRARRRAGRGGPGARAPRAAATGPGHRRGGRLAAAAGEAPGR